MAFRILAFFVLAISILFMPFWVSIILAFLGMVYFFIFWEATILFLLSDLLFGIKGSGHSPFLFISFFISILMLLIIELIKTRMAFYKK